MQLTIEHRTSYQYDEMVNYTIQQLRLTPQEHFGQRVIRWEIKVNGQLQRFDDAFGNVTHTLVLDRPHDRINIVAHGEVETEQAYNALDGTLPVQVYLRETPLTRLSNALSGFAHEFHDTNRLEAMIAAIVEKVPYNKGITNAKTSAAEAFELQGGVCQDHAHIFIACCRSLGLPARYVSGYLFTQDGSLMESHGWADVWLGEQGWQSFDVSNQCRTTGVHIRLAHGLDYRDAGPVSGMRLGGGLENMGVSVLVNQSGQGQQTKLGERIVQEQIQQQIQQQ
jgi:transglutaminase-like putative cysteine protease